MDADFWHRKWADREIGFHASEAHPFLVAHLNALDLDRGARVFLPLTGKTLDAGWLLGRGHRVVGAELSETAVRELFEELGVEPEVSDVGPVRRFRADGLDVLVGDVFDVTAEMLGPVDAVYDRAALVALPETMRARYAAHVAEITGHAPQLVVTFEYEEGLVDGPPFSVPEAEVQRLYRQVYSAQRVAEREVALRGAPAREQAWRLLPTGTD